MKRIEDTYYKNNFILVPDATYVSLPAWFYREARGESTYIACGTCGHLFESYGEVHCILHRGWQPQQKGEDGAR